MSTDKMVEQPAQQDNPHPEYCKGYAAGLEAGAISEKKSVQQVRWDSTAVDMTGAMATLPKTGSESAVDYIPAMSDAGSDANIIWPENQFALKGTGVVTITNTAQQHTKLKEKNGF